MLKKGNSIATVKEKKRRDKEERRGEEEGKGLSGWATKKNFYCGFPKAQYYTRINMKYIIVNRKLDNKNILVSFYHHTGRTSPYFLPTARLSL